jgi:hypothetical protein
MMKKIPEFVGLLCEVRPLIFEEEEVFLRSFGGLQDASLPLKIKKQILSNNIKLNSMKLILVLIVRI